ncbi:60S ribosomal protein L36 [Penicillium citrinum]|uniref:60S ribosomal protein L36 n=1 Tax=Penicillium citrinum TaxID=5077 RepID=A0A9W9TLG8_PENCI|nr:60S ribosomal protein L36 [Penicillium citrinum]KAJ5227196.1 60S ribosomal protein L36 [Penicillium citrinum]
MTVKLSCALSPNPSPTDQRPPRLRLCGSAKTRGFPHESLHSLSTTTTANPSSHQPSKWPRNAPVSLLAPTVATKPPPLNTPKNKISRTKGQSSRRTAFVREVAREVVGLAPYERRIIELLRNTQDKRARKLAKKRLGTFVRGKRKVEDMQRVIAESRRVQGH